MKDFYCVCGQRVFFENSQCLKCGRALGFDPQSQTMLALQPQASGELLSDDGQRFRNCRNHHDFGACNWLLPVDDQRTYCQSCRLNKVVPDLSETGTVIQWAKLEAAKRHLIYTLMQLGLPVEGKQEAAELGISFAFLEDSRFNANVREAYIATGHASGLITLNLAEADDEHREKTRRQLGEYYRTIVGHFRHESGHYYYDLLVRGKQWETPFRELFGNPDRDYQKALYEHYGRPTSADWPSGYISAYAMAHPLEDWAETWAHYLHMQDTLETAREFGAIAHKPGGPAQASGEDLSGGGRNGKELDELVADWMELTVTLNALNRSMGLPDAYPFVLNDRVVAKLRLIHQVIAAARQ